MNILAKFCISAELSYRFLNGVALFLVLLELCLFRFDNRSGSTAYESLVRELSFRTLDFAFHRVKLFLQSRAFSLKVYEVAERNVNRCGVRDYFNRVFVCIIFNYLKRSGGGESFKERGRAGEGFGIFCLDEQL